MAEEELVNSDKKNMAASVEKPSQLLPKGDDGHSDEVDLDEEDDEVAALESEKDKLVFGLQFSLKEQIEKIKKKREKINEKTNHGDILLFRFSPLHGFLNEIGFMDVGIQQRLRKYLGKEKGKETRAEHVVWWGLFPECIFDLNTICSVACSDQFLKLETTL
ncbi:hypothetical protein DVH24_012426 [Malus domestica]|uniref:Uncharacterized protein n=1 Tax=Malus domestica TaxID=3750 RepID=A0A498HS02_MALDO|nr:hypothetical protein DVH24_012426 [Malus domestica]